jgi:hypothetical protein
VTPDDPVATPAGISGSQPAITGARSGQARAGASRSAFTIAAAAPPVLTTIAPTSATIGGATFQLTATGSNFDPAALLLWNGAPLTTTRVSATQLTAWVTPPATGPGSTVAVVVRNGSGVTSAPQTFTLLAPAPPVLTTITPTSATIGDPAFTLTATGSNFDTGAVLLWNGAAVPTTRVSATQLTTLVTVPATGTGSSVSVVVRNGTLALSAAQTFTILAPAPPVLTTIAPTSATLFDPDFTLTATGSNFDTGAVILWNGAALPTSRNSSTQLTAPVTLAGATAGTIPVVVRNATLAESASQSFVINPAPIPVLSSILPTAKNSGDVFTLIAYGSSFRVGAVIVWNGTPRTTTRASATELSTPIDLGGAVPGTVPVLVRNPGGLDSASQPFVIHPAVIPNQKIPVIVIGGVATGAAASRRVLIESLSIHDQLNEVPNTCTFTVQGDRPVEGAEILIAYGSANSPARLFAGTILRGTQLYVAAKPSNVLWQVEGIDYTWELNRRLVVAKYTNQSASAIAANLVATWAPAGFTTAIQAGLPVLDEISFTNTPLMDAMAQLATRIGGYANCDYFKAIGLWITPPGSPPSALTPTHPTLQEFQVTRDLSQVVTRALVEGGGVNSLALVPPGETRLPVEDSIWYPANGRVVSGPQRLTYSSVVPGGSGAIVGPGVSPGAAPAAASVAGGTLAVGTYKYAYTWVTAAGETLASPQSAAMPTGPIPNPTIQPSCTGTTGGNIPPSQMYAVYYGYSTDGSGAMPPADHTTLQGGSVSLGPTSTAINAANVPYSADPRVKAIVVARTLPALGDTNAYYTGEIVPNDASKGGQAITVKLTKGDAAITQTSGNRAPVGTPNTTGGNQFSVSGIALGPGGVTARKVYRTAVNGSALKLLTTIANNTATSLPALDTAADGTLGAAPPVTDTSGVTSSASGGQILPGATSCLVSSLAPFGTTGWARVGEGQVIRYTGAAGNSLTGIPTSGPGAITSAISYGSTILVAPQLIGIPASGAGAIKYQILPGDAVNLLVIVDDPASQAALAAQLGGNGVVEEYQQDRRISATEATARAQALLDLKGPILETYHYRSRDPGTRSGTTITVDLPAPTDVHGTYEIQDVTITGFLGTDEYPFYDVTASSRRFTFEDLLRRRRAATTTG